MVNVDILVTYVKNFRSILCNLKSSDQSTNVIDQPAVHTGMKPSYFLREGLQKTRDLAILRVLIILFWSFYKILIQ